MKKQDIKIAFILFVLAIAAKIVHAQDESTGLPGEHFSLEGTLELFKTSKDLATFEKSLNKPNNKVNNLDLNEDGEVDYIRVIDNAEDGAHAIVLQVPVSKTESQDVAVIHIQKEGNESATLQIVGDEDIYGESILVEPFAEQGSGGHGGPDANYDIVRVTVNVWLWSPVRYLYAPRYVRYVSPWRWSYYPGWYRPWRPLTWTVWRPVRYYNPARYRVTTTFRLPVARRVYTPVRTRSVIVKTRTTKVLATNGQRTVVGTRTTKTVVAKNGNKTVVAKKTNTKAIATNGKKTVAGKNSTRAVAATNGRKVAAAKRSSTKKAIKKNKNSKVKKTTTKVRKRRKA